jgi:3-hydroxyacyl-CoA dehydrogenase
MGSGIATALILAGYQVLLKEVNQQFLDVSFKVKKVSTVAEALEACALVVAGQVAYPAQHVCLCI